jgi:hypothetical protein
MSINFFSIKKYRFSQWEFNFCSIGGKTCTAACFLVVTIRELWEDDCYIQHKFSDNGVMLKWLFRWICFMIKWNICGKIGTPGYMPLILYFERLTIGGICFSPTVWFEGSVFLMWFQIYFLIKSAKLTFILESIDDSNCRYKSIPRTCLWAICDFGGLVKECKIYIYIWAILWLYNPLIKVWHIFLIHCTVGRM